MFSTARPSRYFNQGLRFNSAFKFDFAVASQLTAVELDPTCIMCHWGLALAYGQNLNDALVMALEPEFLANEPLAYEAITRAQNLISAVSSGDSSSGDDSTPAQERDAALVSALGRKFVSTQEEYESYFVDGLPMLLNLGYAESMATAAARSKKEGWPDPAMVLVLSADAWMNLSPWDCEFQ